MCTERENPGIESNIGREDDDEVGKTFTYGSRVDCHIAMVPPFAFPDESGRSGQITSSLLRLKESFP